MDALVIGAGPAGLMAAETMAARGRRVVVAEAKPSIGRKFLMAGKTGLNITKDEGMEAFLAAYRCPELAPMLQAFGPAQVMDWCRALGVEVFTGSSGRVFPNDDDAQAGPRRDRGRTAGGGGVNPALSPCGVRFTAPQAWIAPSPQASAASRTASE